MGIKNFALKTDRWLAPIFVTLILSFGQISHADEGFFLKSETMPEAVKKAWESVFFVNIENPLSRATGTAFLVRKVAHRRSTELYFVTNYHVLETYCPNVGICINATLSQDSDVTKKDGFSTLNALQGLVFHNIRIKHYRKNPDLALLLVSVDTPANRLPNPLNFSPTCELNWMESLYTIGFSTPSMRTTPQVAIEDPLTVRKRWSRGLFTGFLRHDFGDGLGTQYFAGSTVDYLKGGSGGPLLNEAGEVVGVSTLTAATKENGYRYDGNENPEHLGWHNGAVMCEYFPEFIDNIDVKPNIK